VTARATLRAFFASGRLLGVALLAGLLVLRAWDPVPVESLRLRTFDLYQQLDTYAPATRPVAIVDVDDASLKTVGQWPWARTELAVMVQRLMQAGAVVVAFDVVFAEPDRLSPGRFAETAVGVSPALAQELDALPSNDAVFAQVLKQNRVVLGQGAKYVPDKLDGARDPVLTPVAEFNGDPRPFLLRFPEVLRNLPEFETSAAGRGMFTLNPERDGIVRRVPAVQAVGDNLYPALAVEMLRVATGQAQYAVKRLPGGGGIGSVTVARVDIPTDAHGRVWVRFTPHDPALYVRAADVLHGTFDPARIAGKLVLIGASAEGLRDLKATPLERALPGVEVHAQLLTTILNGAYLNRPSSAVAYELAATAVVALLMIALVPLLGAWWTLGIGGGLALLLVGGSYYAFDQHRLLLDPGYPALASFAVFLLLVYRNYAREEVERRRVRHAFSQYLSPALVEQLAAHPERLKLGGETREMSILFCDVEDFTAISERHKEVPQELTELMNRLMTPLTDAVLDNGGTIDKYMGDCVMAFWNAPLDDASHAEHACVATREMFARLEALNAARREEAQAAGTAFIPLNVSVGVNTGEVVVGNMGSDQHFDYSVLGDAVNLASRLQGQALNYGVRNVIGPDTAAQVAHRFALIELDLIAVKGKQEAVRVFTIVGDREVLDDPAFQELAALHDQMLAAYRAQDWETADRIVEECATLTHAPRLLYAVYAERILDYRLSPPGPDWDGVHIARSK